MKPISTAKTAPLKLPVALLFSFFFLVHITSRAQALDLTWVRSGGGTALDQSRSMMVDAAGNIYFTGLFNGTADFDPGPGTYNMTASGENEIYIAKYDGNGNFIWAKQISGTDSYKQSHSITSDKNGNICVTGYFSGTADFDPGPGIFSLTAFGASDIFALKLDGAGNLVWAKQLGGLNYDIGWGIVADNNNNFYITGEYTSIDADFDPGAGVFTMASNGNNDIFITKLDAGGNFVWAKAVGSTETEQGASVTVDPAGDICVTGLFSGINVDFDPGNGIYSMSSTGSTDIFILKLSAAGNFIFAKQLGGNSGSDKGACIYTDKQGNIFTTGYFHTGADFDPGPGVYTLATNGSAGIFISKLDVNGNFVWAKQFSGPTVTPLVNTGHAIADDAAGNIYIAGYFTETVDFNPSAAVFNRTSNGEGDIFLAVLDASGNFVNVKTFGSSSSESATCLRTDANNNIYISGFFSQTVNFSACSGTYNLNSGGSLDFFVAKFAAPQVTISTSAQQICQGAAVSFTATAVNPGPSPVYQWLVNGIVTSTTGPVFTSTSIQHNDKVKAVLITNPSCSPPVTDTSNEIVMTVNQAETPSVTITASATTICTGSAVGFTATSTGSGTSPVYQWLVNGNPAGTGTPVFTSTTLLDNDEVKLVLTNNSPCASPNTVVSNSIRITVQNSIVPYVKISAATGSICPGDTATFAATAFNAPANPELKWMLNGSLTGVSGPAYQKSGLVTGDKVYCLMYASSSCTTATQFYSDTVVMDIKQLPQISITPLNPVISKGSTVQLTAVIGGPYSNYTWTPAAGLNNSNTLSPVAGPLVTTAYALKVTGANGCMAGKEVVVTVSNDIYIPNAFTPDKNGRNDVFRIPPGILFDLEDFSVYNRYGETVFQTRDITKGWDGTFKNSTQPGGIYVYTIRGTGIKGPVYLKGTILLIR